MQRRIDARRNPACSLPSFHWKNRSIWRSYLKWAARRVRYFDGGRRLGLARAWKCRWFAGAVVIIRLYDLQDPNLSSPRVTKDCRQAGKTAGSYVASNHMEVPKLCSTRGCQEEVV